MMKKYFIEYDNDTGPSDDYYKKFWLVKLGDPDKPHDAEIICQCTDENNASLVKYALEVYERL